MRTAHFTLDRNIKEVAAALQAEVERSEAGPRERTRNPNPNPNPNAQPDCPTRLPHPIAPPYCPIAQSPYLDLPPRARAALGRGVLHGEGQG